MSNEVTITQDDIYEALKVRMVEAGYLTEDAAKEPAWNGEHQRCYESWAYHCLGRQDYRTVPTTMDQLSEMGVGVQHQEQQPTSTETDNSIDPDTATNEGSTDPETVTNEPETSTETETPVDDAVVDTPVANDGAGAGDAGDAGAADAAADGSAVDEVQE